MPLINSNTLNEWAMGIPQRARGLLADIKDAPRQIGLLFDPKFQKGLLDQRSVTDTFNKSKAEQLAMDLMTTTPAGGIAGTFIGKGAKTWNTATNAKAMQMAKKGVDPRTIWKETGNWKAPDGMWRQEIPDNLARFNAASTTPNNSYMEVGIGNLGDAMNHPRLSQAYPDLNRITLELNPNIGSQGSYADNVLQVKRPSEPIRKSHLKDWQKRLMQEETPDQLEADARYLAQDGISMDEARQIVLDTKAEELANIRRELSNADFTRSETSTTLHELQHAIQEREGWARGGASDMAFRDARMWGRDGAEGSDIAQQMLSDKMRELSTPMPIEDYAKQAWQSNVVTPEIVADYASYAKNIKQNATKFNNEAQKTVAQEWYRRLAGEAEARATQARMNMDMAQRLNTFPEDSYDVPISQLIIRGLLER